MKPRRFKGTVADDINELLNHRLEDHVIEPGFMFIPRTSITKEPILVISKRWVMKMAGGYWSYLCLTSGGCLEWHSYMYYDHIISRTNDATRER